MSASGMKCTAISTFGNGPCKSVPLQTTPSLMLHQLQKLKEIWRSLDNINLGFSIIPRLNTKKYHRHLGGCGYLMEFLTSGQGTTLLSNAIIRSLILIMITMLLHTDAIMFLEASFILGGRAFYQDKITYSMITSKLQLTKCFPSTMTTISGGLNQAWAADSTLPQHMMISWLKSLIQYQTGPNSFQILRRLSELWCCTKRSQRSHMVQSLDL